MGPTSNALSELQMATQTKKDPLHSKLLGTFDLPSCPRISCSGCPARPKSLPKAPRGAAGRADSGRGEGVSFIFGPAPPALCSVP
jgi:hypothetical protein